MTRRLLAYVLLAAPAAAAPADASSIVAGHAAISMVTGETILTGNPHVDYGDLRLTADEIRINPKSHTATAHGHAVLTQGPRRLLADEITYHEADGTYEVGPLRAGEFPVYVTGSHATGDRQHLIVYDARVSVPEPGELVPTLEAARLYFTGDQQVRAEHASLGIGSMRPITLPAFNHDPSHPIVSNVSLSGGYRSNVGAYAIASLHLPVAANLRVGADVGFYTSRGLMAGPSGSYGAEAEDASYRGSFRSGFINDYGDRGTDILERPVAPNRGYFEWQHQQQIGDRFSITGQLNYWSDSEVLRDFRPGEFFPVQQPDTFVESAYTGGNFILSLFARVQPNTWEAVQQRLPELRFDLFPTAIGGGVYEQANASAAILRERALPPSPFAYGSPTELRSTRYDAYYGLSRPLRPTDWFTFTPVAGGRLTEYTAMNGPRDNTTRVLGEVGFDTELHVSGRYEYKNDRWKIDGLRHLFTPRISYRYIPEAEKGARTIPPIDRESFSTYLQPLGLADTRNLDQLRATNTLRLGFDNTLQTRDPVYGSRDLLRLNIANDFRFHRLPGEKDVSLIHTELAAMPARWIELNMYESFSPQTFKLRELNTGITVRDGDEWRLRFSSNFLRDTRGFDANELLYGSSDPHVIHGLYDFYVQGNRRLNEVFEAITLLRYDQRQHRFIEQSYGVRQNVGNTWTIEYLVSLYEGRRRESGFGFNVRIDAVRF